MLEMLNSHLTTYTFPGMYSLEALSYPGDRAEQVTTHSPLQNLS